MRNVSTGSKSCAVVWTLTDCYCSVAGCTCDPVTTFEPDTTFPALVQATWVIFEKSRRVQKSLKKALAWSWRQLSAAVGYFSTLCDWQNKLCDFPPSTIHRTEFDSVQTHVLYKIPTNTRKSVTVNRQYFRCTRGRPKKPSFFNGRGPVDLLGCKRGECHGSKKIAGRGHNLWTPLGLRNLILNSSSQQCWVPATHSGIHLKLKWNVGRPSVPFSRGEGHQCSPAWRWTSHEGGKWFPYSRWTWPIDEARGSEVSEGETASASASTNAVDKCRSAGTPQKCRYQCFKRRQIRTIDTANKRHGGGPNIFGHYNHGYCWHFAWTSRRW